MNRITLIVLLCIVGSLQAQNDVLRIQNKINTEVWKEFKSAFETLDANALNAIYINKALRVTPNGIDTQNSFKKGNLDRFNTNRKEGITISLDFWFDSRQTNETTSYEVGFYRIGATKEGVATYSYGQFHIVLKKINGQWKITQDWDTASINGKAIDATDFSQQKPLAF